MSKLSVGSRSFAGFLTIEQWHVTPEGLRLGGAKRSALRISNRIERPSTISEGAAYVPPVDIDQWSSVPVHQRSIVRAYINSDNPDDRERSIALCKRYGLDYAAARRVVLDEMIAQSRELGYPVACAGRK